MASEPSVFVSADKSATASPPSTATVADNESTPQGTSFQNAVPVASSLEPRKCWICHTEETEDSPLNKDWRSPCFCSLTAHEACLLNWVAYLEHKILCPSCRSDIVVFRRRSYIVGLVSALESMALHLITPAAALALEGTAWSWCRPHGTHSMYGAEEARRIIETSTGGWWNPGVNLGIPFTPLILVARRTRFAGRLLPVVAVPFIVALPSGQECHLDPRLPSAAMVLPALPCVDYFYNGLYERLFGKLERRWVAEAPPRLCDSGEFRISIILEEIPWTDDTSDIDDNVPQAAPELGNMQDQENQKDEDDRHGWPPLDLSSLAFPAISAAMGGLLQHILPKSWTTPLMLERSLLGLLQTRWGRTVVGGCVFVLLKDAVRLYCRWKRVQLHRARRVLDRAKRQVVD